MIEAVYFLVFFLGVVVGSFLNVVILRHERSLAITGRSVCMHCKKQLRWYELIPLASFLLQKGKCRGCGTKLSLQYPLVECATGVLFLLSYRHVLGGYWVGNGYTYFVLFLHVVIWSLFVVITVYDYHTKLIPNEFSYTLAFFAFALLFVSRTGLVLPTIWGLLAGPMLFLPFYVLWKVSDGRWLGLGDGKLSLGIGWFLGLVEGSTAVLYAFWIGAVVSLAIMGVQKLRQGSESAQLTLRSEVPFGPFLVLGTLIVYVWGVDLYTLLLSL